MSCFYGSSSDFNIMAEKFVTKYSVGPQTMLITHQFRAASGHKLHIIWCDCASFSMSERLEKNYKDLNIHFNNNK